jgi:hypothetical protein
MFLKMFAGKEHVDLDKFFRENGMLKEKNPFFAFKIKFIARTTIIMKIY